MAKLDKLRKKATKLIKKFGKANITLKDVEVVFNEATGGTLESVTAGPVTLEGSVSSPSVDMVNGTTVLASDLQINVADQKLNGLVPRPGITKATFNGIDYHISLSRPLYSGDLVATWNLTLRM